MDIVFEATSSEAGFRVRTLYPKGFYVTSKNPVAAKYWFVANLLEFIGQRGDVVMAEGESIQVTPFDWDEVISKGHGQTQIVVIPADQTTAWLADPECVAVDDPNFAELEIDWFQHASGNLVCIVRDCGEAHDDWLVQAAHQDFGGRVH